MPTRRRDLGGEPAAERQPDERDLLVRQCVEDRQVEVHQVVDGLEVGRPRRVAEARMRRRDDLGVPAEQIEEPRVGRDMLHTVQEQHRTPRPAANHLQVDASDR